MFFGSFSFCIVQDITNANIEFVVVCQSVSCGKEIDELENEKAQYVKKIKEMKQKYHAALIENLKKDVIIGRLLDRKEHCFDNFKAEFSFEALESLRKHGNSPSADSSFILTAIRDLYKGNINLLKNISFTNRSKSKTQMSPQKRTVLQRIYDERMKYLDEIGANVKERKNKLSLHIKIAIRNA